MIKLLIEIISRFFESFLTNVPRIPKDWFVASRILFYVLAFIIYIIAFTVIFTVYLMVILVAYPVSLIYENIR